MFLTHILIFFNIQVNNLDNINKEIHFKGIKQYVGKIKRLVISKRGNYMHN